MPDDARHDAAADEGTDEGLGCHPELRCTLSEQISSIRVLCHKRTRGRRSEEAVSVDLTTFPVDVEMLADTCESAGTSTGEEGVIPRGDKISGHTMLRV